MWLKLKRAFLLVAGVVVTLLGLSVGGSALFGYYGKELGLIAGLTVAGLLLIALGVFIARVAVRGTDREVSDMDLM